MIKDISEAELAQKFLSFIHGWEIYPEVEVKEGFIDIIAVNKVNKYKMAIEVKKTFNFKLLEQGIRSKKYANFVYLAIPYTRDLEFRKKLCRDYGLGLLLMHDDGRIIESVKPKFNDKLNKIMLSEHQKKSVAGSQHDRVTSFDITKLNIVDYLNKNNGACDAKLLLENIQHHYNNNTTALNSLKAWIKKGIIKEFTFENKKFILKK